MTEATRASFPTRRIRRPYDGFFMPYTTCNHTLEKTLQGLGRRLIQLWLNYIVIIETIQKTERGLIKVVILVS